MVEIPAITEPDIELQDMLEIERPEKTNTHEGSDTDVGFRRFIREIDIIIELELERAAQPGGHASKLQVVLRGFRVSENRIRRGADDITALRLGHEIKGGDHRGRHGDNPAPGAYADPGGRKMIAGNILFPAATVHA